MMLPTPPTGTLVRAAIAAARFLAAPSLAVVGWFCNGMLHEVFSGQFREVAEACGLLAPVIAILVLMLITMRKT